MRGSISLLIVTWLSAVTVAARRPSEVKYFEIWPATRCEDAKREDPDIENPCEDNFDGDDEWNIPSARWIYDICGDGTFCRYGFCGKFLGKEKMCCGGKAYNGQLGNIPTGPQSSIPKLDCQDYVKVLENYDYEKKGKAPETKNCQNKHWDENYPVGISGWKERGEFWTGKTTPKQCCGIEQDAINLYTNSSLDPIDKAVCIPPLDDEMAQKSTKSSAVRLNGSSTVSLTVLMVAILGVIHFSN